MLRLRSFLRFAADLRREKSRLTSEKDSLTLDLKKARKEADEMLDNWRKEVEEEEDENESEEDEEEGEEAKDDDSSEEEESETDSSDADAPAQLNGISNASSTTNSTAASTSSLMSGSRMRIGEGGPSQWSTEGSVKKGETVVLSSDSEEEESVQLVSSDTK